MTRPSRGRQSREGRPGRGLLVWCSGSWRRHFLCRVVLEPSLSSSEDPTRREAAPHTHLDHVARAGLQVWTKRSRDVVRASAPPTRGSSLGSQPAARGRMPGDLAQMCGRKQLVQESGNGERSQFRFYSSWKLICLPVNNANKDTVAILGRFLLKHTGI